MRKIIVLSVGRSDYDRYYPIIKKLNNNSKIDLYLYLTKAHQSKIFGKTINFVDKKFKILKKKIETKKVFNNDTKKEITKNFSEDLTNLSDQIKSKNPDFLIVLGDRYEMLLGPVAAAPFNVPVIHFYGGAVTEGAIDELIRHSITKMSHYHFVALDTYKKRLIQLGEEEWRVKKIGIHELNYLKKIKKLNKKELSKKFNFNFIDPYLLVTYHPVTLELQNLNYQLKSLAYALKRTKLNIIFTYPNADPGYEKIVRFIKKNFKNKNKYKIFKNAGLNVYSSLMKNCHAVIGNSSSGIVEAASFKRPVVNIGTRQNGKFIPKNVVSTNYLAKDISKGIDIALSKKFNAKIKNLTNPYESNTSVNQIVKMILKLKANDKLLRKKFKNII